MLYCCKRCGKNSKHLGDFKKHLNRKKPCEPLYSSVDRSVLLQELATPEGKGGFVVQNEVIPYEDIEDAKSFTMQMQEDLIKLKQENLKLKKENADMASKLQALQVGGVTNVTNNITHIHLNNYYKEDTSYITDECLFEMLVKVYESVPNVIKAIHFNPEHPENHNVKMPNKRDKYMMVRRSNEWKHENKKDVIGSLVMKGHGFIDSRCTEDLLEKMKTHQREAFDKLMQELDNVLHYNENGEVYADICDRMEKMLLNVRVGCASGHEA